jgi:glucose/arabinose dehydrogenase
MKRLLLSSLCFLTIAFYQAQNPAFTQTTMVSGLTYPVAFDMAPDGRFFVTQKGGNSAGSCANGLIKVFDANGTFLANFYNLTDSVQCDFERGLLGICIDPDFSNNHFVYAYYNHLYAGDERIRVIKFTESNNLGTNPVIILDINVANNIAGNHVGGNIHMHASEPNKIYVSIGDIAVQANGQTKTDPYGSFLRINTDGTIPSDNPYYDDGNPSTGNDDRIWTYGHRNAFDFTFSAVNDSLYSSENGLNTWDEVNMIHKGKNYGWNSCEGFFTLGSTSNPCALAGSELPIEDWAAPLPAITGILHYSGSVFPTLTNHLLVADNDYGRIYDITLSNPPAYDQFVSRTQWADFTTTGGLTTLKQGLDECIYAMKGGYTTAGAIYRICPLGMEVTASNTLPELISVFPNPATENFTFHVELNESSAVLLNFYDVTGRLVGTNKSENLPGGKNLINVNVKETGIEKGLLFCEVTVQLKTGGEKSTTLKLVIE